MEIYSHDRRSYLGLLPMLISLGCVLLGVEFAARASHTMGTLHTQNIVVDNKVQLGTIAPSASQRVFLDDNSATDTTIFWTQSDSIHHVGTGGNNEMIHFVSRMNDTFDTTAGNANGAIHDEIANCGVDTGTNDVTCSVHNVNAFCTTAHCTAYVWNSQSGILRHDDTVVFGGAGGTASVSLGNTVQRFTVMPTSPTTTIPQLDIGIQAPVDGFAMHTKRTDSTGSLSGILVELDTTLSAVARGGFIISRGAGGGAAGNNAGIAVSGGAGYPFTTSAANDFNVYTELGGPIVFGADGVGFTAGMQLTTGNQLDMLTHKIINVATPTASGDAATKGYVDGKAVTVQQAAFHLDSGTGLYTKQQGMSGAPVKNGTGDWSLAYTPALNTDQGIVLCQVQDQATSATRMNITVETVDTTHIRVRTFSNGTASDQHFWCTISSIN